MMLPLVRCGGRFRALPPMEEPLRPLRGVPHAGGNITLGESGRKTRESLRRRSGRVRVLPQRMKNEPPRAAVVILLCGLRVLDLVLPRTTTRWQIRSTARAGGAVRAVGQRVQQLVGVDPQGARECLVSRNSGATDTAYGVLMILNSNRRPSFSFGSTV